MAKHANGAELSDGFRARHQVEHLTKGLALEGTVQSCNDDDLAEVGSLLAEGINVIELEKTKSGQSRISRYHSSSTGL